MSKLTQKEKEEYIDIEYDHSVHLMYTAMGVRLRMKVAEFYFNHYNVLTHIVIQIPLMLIFVLDSIEFIREKQEFRFCKKDEGCRNVHCAKSGQCKYNIYKIGS